MPPCVRTSVLFVGSVAASPPPPTVCRLLPLALVTGPAAPSSLNRPSWSGCVLRDRVRYAVHPSESGESLEMLMATDSNKTKFRNKETKARLAGSDAETIQFQHVF